MKNPENVLGIGELLWDILPEGKKLGGAPCNFVYHANKLGAKAIPLSAVGNDENGKEILETLQGNHVSTELIQVNEKPTGTVDVKLNAQGVPEYTIHENVAWDYINIDKSIEQRVKDVDILCFGSLAQRNGTSGDAIISILKTSRTEAFKVFDINLRQHYYNRDIIENSLELCNVLKLNEEELQIVSRMLKLTGNSDESQIEELINKYKLLLVALTRGSENSLLMTHFEESILPTPKVKVKDTVGAGDSFTAAMIVGFARGNSLSEIHEKAVEISAFVCTQEGAMPEYNKVKF